VSQHHRVVIDAFTQKSGFEENVNNGKTSSLVLPPKARAKVPPTPSIRTQPHDTREQTATNITMNGSRRRITSHDGVPDLTPHINDPMEHLRNIFKGFCGQNLDLGDRQPPVVDRTTIEARKRSPEVCGFLCMDSHSKVVKPCLPWKCEEVELQTTGNASTTTTAPLVQQRTIVLPEEPSQELEGEEEDAALQDDKSAFWIMDMLMATVLALFVTVYALRRCGYALDLSIDDKSFAESQLLVIGEPWHEAVSTCHDDAKEDVGGVSYPWNDTHVQS